MFKRRTLGLCGEKSIKTLDEIVNALVISDIVSPRENGKKFLPALINEGFLYSDSLDFEEKSYLAIYKVGNLD